ncbi:MAG TPA: glycosyltransferase [bacterium]|nr:glycosyltransferase [bacterium]
MKILHVDPETEWRGGERQVLLLARELARRGHETPVACDPRGALCERARAIGLVTEPLRMAGDLDLPASVKTAGLLRRHRPDVLHLHTSRAHGAGGLGARMAGHRPVLVTRRLELPARGAASRWKYRHLADHYVAISEAVENSLLQAGVSRERVDRIPSGVELPGDSAEPPRGSRPWTVGTLAAFTPQKDPDTWVRVVKDLAAEDPDVRFVWAGAGNLAGKVEVAVEEAGLRRRVDLPGFLEDPGSFWAGIDVFFLPSAFEALGTVFLDALARGIPVVATRAGGIPEVVRDGKEGLLAPVGNVAALSAALRRVKDDPDLAGRLGAAGRIRAREFEIGGVVDRIVTLYSQLRERAHAGGGR